MDVSIAYTIWAGLGTALIATVGILWFREPGGQAGGWEGGEFVVFVK